MTTVPSLQKILYVEDNLDIQEVVSMTLEDLGGFQMKICTKGKDALAVANSFNPDLLLLDIMMPDINGVDLLKEFRKTTEHAETPALFMTAKIQTLDILSYKEMGVLGVIAKPFDPITLSDSIRTLWEHYHTEKEITKT